MIQFTRRAMIIGGYELYWYGMLIALGVLAGVVLSLGREKKLGFKKDSVIDLVLIGAPLAIICARLYYVVFSWEYYAANPGGIFAIRDGGMAIYGGIIGAVIAGLIYCRWKRISFLSVADLAAPGLAIGQCIGRWGNFLNQEAYGAAVANPALHFFPVSVYIDANGWHYATFFYESLWCALIVIALLTGEKKGFFKKRGDIFLTYILMYALERTAVEGLRTDSLYLGPVRISQLVSMAAVIVIAAMMAKRSKGAIRFLPLGGAMLMCIGVILQSVPFTAVFSLLTLGFAAAAYKTSCA